MKVYLFFLSFYFTFNIFGFDSIYFDEYMEKKQYAMALNYCEDVMKSVQDENTRKQILCYAALPALKLVESKLKLGGENYERGLLDPAIISFEKAHEIATKYNVNSGLKEDVRHSLAKSRLRWATDTKVRDVEAEEWLWEFNDTESKDVFENYLKAMIDSYNANVKYNTELNNLDNVSVNYFLQVLMEAVKALRDGDSLLALERVNFIQFRLNLLNKDLLNEKEKQSLSDTFELAKKMFVQSGASNLLERSENIQLCKKERNLALFELGCGYYNISKLGFIYRNQIAEYPYVEKARKYLRLSLDLGQLSDEDKKICDVYCRTCESYLGQCPTSKSTVRNFFGSSEVKSPFPVPRLPIVRKRKAE
jgi:hypothetical protein